MKIRNSKLETRNRQGAGFTLIELLLVIAILGVLAALIVPKFAGRTEQARIAAAQSDIATMGMQLDAYEVDNGAYPRGQNGLNDLITQPRDAQNWRGPYIKDLKADPWGNAYIYAYPGKNNASGYDLSSMGPDGKANTDDDITNWTTTK
jgi:general secretion pathway protein G